MTANIRISLVNRFATCLVAICMLSASTLNAAVPEEKEKEIKTAIDRDLTAALDKLVNNKTLAARYEFEFPVKEPAKTLAAVQGIVEKTIVMLAKEKHPKSWINQQLEKEKHKFVLWTESDKVKGKTRDGKDFDGYLRKIQSTSIMVDTKRVYFKDMVPETYVHLNPQKAKDLKSQIRKRYVGELIAMRTRYARIIRLDQTRDIYKKEGYIRVSGSWKPKAEFFRERVAAERAKYKALIANDLTYKHYYNAGYRLFEGEWYTPQEVARLKHEAFVKKELAPKSLMALFDALNKEGSESVVAGDVRDLFGEDDDAKKKDDAKKDKEDTF